MMVLPCQFHGGRRDDAGNLLFCGEKSLPMFSYCAKHRSVIFAKVHPRDVNRIDRLGTFARAGVPQ
jgi:hypothetical protein